MSTNSQHELYQQVILDHNKKPQNFKKLENPTHFAEGYNPLCGDHLQVYLKVDAEGKISEISFEGSGFLGGSIFAVVMAFLITTFSNSIQQKGYGKGSGGTSEKSH